MSKNEHYTQKKQNEKPKSIAPLLDGLFGGFGGLSAFATPTNNKKKELNK